MRRKLQLAGRRPGLDTGWLVDDHLSRGLVACLATGASQSVSFGAAVQEMPCLCHHMQVPGTQYAAMYMCATSSGACIRSSARSAGSRSSAGEATAVQSESEDAQTTAAAVRRKSVRVLRTHAGLQLRGGTSMHSDARALPRRRVTRSGCGMSRLSKLRALCWDVGREKTRDGIPPRDLQDLPSHPCHHGAQNLGPGEPRVEEPGMLLVHLCHGFQLRHDAHTQCLAALCREHSVDTTSFSILRTTAVQCRAPPYVPRRSDFLRTTAVKCTEPYVPYVPSREPYVPSWAQGGSAKKNVYAEQRTEYEEYAKVLQAGEAGASEESRDTPLAPPSLEVIEGALRAALAPVLLRCGEQGPSLASPFGRPASPLQASWPRRADPRSCPGPPLTQLWPKLCRRSLPHRCTTWL